MIRIKNFILHVRLTFIRGVTCSSVVPQFLNHTAYKKHRLQGHKSVSREKVLRLRKKSDKFNILPHGTLAVSDSVALWSQLNPEYCSSRYREIDEADYSLRARISAVTRGAKCNHPYSKASSLVFPRHLNISIQTNERHVVRWRKNNVSLLNRFSFQPATFLRFRKLWKEFRRRSIPTDT